MVGNQNMNSAISMEPKNYDGPRKSEYFSHSNFGRCLSINDDLLKYVEDLPKQPNILFVGVGKDNYYDFCSCASGPFEVAAMLENFGKDYEMSVLDYLGENLEDTKNRREIYTSVSMDNEKLWKQYLEFTGHDSHDGFVNDTQVKIAPIPDSFDKNRKNNKIKFIEGDIATKNLKKTGPYDMVQCLNVLVHLDNYDALKSSLWNMSYNTRKGGIIVLDDNHDPESRFRTYTRTSLEKTIGLENIGLDVEKETKLMTDEYSILFLRKK